MIKIGVTKNTKYVDEIVDIHLRTFDGFFLTFLGKGFLKELYAGFMRHESSGIIIAKEDEKVIGFCAYSSDLSGFYKYLLKTRIVNFAWYAFLGFIRKPSAFFRLFRALTYSKTSERNENYVELSSIGVDPEYKNKKIGSKLIKKLCNLFEGEAYEYITLDTDRDDNEGANHFYQNNGFEVCREFSTPEGRMMNEYRYKLNRGREISEILEEKKGKNIWIFCHYAQQPPYNTMLRYHNWGKFLTKRGYDVTIVAANTVHNTDIDVAKEIKAYGSKCDGVKYLYVPCSAYTGNGVARMRNMIQYGLGLKRATRGRKKPDMIIVCEAYLYFFSKMYFKDIPVATDIVDLWPESIIEYAGFSKNNPIIKALYVVEKYAYIKTDSLIFSIEGGKDYVEEQKYSKRVDKDKIFHINMGCDMAEVDRNKKNIQETLPWDMGKYNIVYCGSVRKANNVQQICDAAKALQDRGVDNIHFHIYGNGDELEFLQKYVEENGIKNVSFYGRIEKAKIPYILSNATANILTFKQVNLMKYGGSQSKLFDYLSSGRPIICNAKFGYNLITRYNAGIVTENQTPEAFANAVESLCSMEKAELDEMGIRARKAAEKYDQPILVDKLCEVIDYTIRK